MKKILRYSILLLPLVTLPTFLISCSKNNGTTNDDKNNEGNNQDNDNNEKPQSDLDNQGGLFNGLTVDKFLIVVKSLSLNSQTVLSSLNNQTLNEQLHKKQEYANLNLEIMNNSNEKDGILNLKLLGKYNGKDINDSIKINGFTKENINRLSFFNAEINFEKWFDLKQPIRENNNLNFVSNQKDKISLFQKFDINLKNNDQVIKTISLNDVEKYFELKKFNFSLSNNNMLKVELELETKYQEYNNGQWIKMNDQILITQASNESNEISLPSLNDLKRVMLDKIEFDQEKLSKYYASYFYGKYLYDLQNLRPQTEIMTFISNEQQIWNQYQSTYFKDQTWYLRITRNKDEFIANDENHSLSFSIYLVELDNEEENNISKSFTLNSFKPTNNLDGQYRNDFYIKNDSVLARQIKRKYINEIKNVYSDGVKYEQNIDKLPFDKTIIFDYQNFNESETLLNQITRNFDFFSIFNQDFQFKESNNNNVEQKYLNIKNGLFVISNLDPIKEKEEETIFINSIELDMFNVNLQIEKNTGKDGVNISFNTRVNINSCQKSYLQNANVRLFIAANELNK